MAELSITPKKTIRNLPNLFDKTKTEARERKRNILYLILGYLTDNKMVVAAEALKNDAQLTNQYELCENIDLDIILQDYNSYYYTKFQKYPKIVRKVENFENIKTNLIRKKSATNKRSENQENYDNKSENKDYQFDIISLTTDNSKFCTELCIAEKLYDFKNYSTEWHEMAEQIMREFVPKNLGITWNDCIGLNKTIENLKEATVYPIMFPELFRNIYTWKGVLLYGPPGTGKTLLAKALASEGYTKFINVTSSSFVSKWRGESEKLIQVLFDIAKIYAPTTIFIDEIEALASSSSQLQHEASRRFKSELLAQIDGILSTKSDIFILASTNVPWHIDTALLRRFEKRIHVDLPNEYNRKELLKYYLKQQNTIKKEEFQHLAELTENFSGSDVKSLCKEVIMGVVREKIKEINNGDNKNNILRNITYADVRQALEKVKPCTTIYDCKKYYEWHEKHGSL